MEGDIQNAINSLNLDLYIGKRKIYIFYFNLKNTLELIIDSFLSINFFRKKVYRRNHP